MRLSTSRAQVCWINTFVVSQSSQSSSVHGNAGCSESIASTALVQWLGSIAGGLVMTIASCRLVQALFGLEKTDC